MKFYTFDQNNSGGSFIHDPDLGIGYVVVIEAESQDKAIEKAESIGLYFNGVVEGYDCPCCGDRWYLPWTDNAKELPEHCGVILEAAEDGDELDSEWGINSYIHYADGTFKAVKAQAYD